MVAGGGMKPGYWDREGFHEGPMPAVDFGKAAKVVSAAIDEQVKRNQPALDEMLAEALLDGRAIRRSIVNPDGSVDIIDPRPSPYWLNNTPSLLDGLETSADAGRNEYGRPSGQVANSPQPVIGVPRGGCESFPRGSRHSSESEAAWVERELGDVGFRGLLSFCEPRPETDLDAATVGDCT